MKLVECVPNFSEGRDKQLIDEIVRDIASVEGVRVLDTDPGVDTNRTVVTFVGEPEAVLEGAFQGIKSAAERIDMRHHTGAHARLGATDVCPFVPVTGVTVDECIDLAKRLGRRVASELGIPVYLYEKAATRPERQNLADIRAGEYEGLAEKLEDPEWVPDFGEAVFNERSGATVIGVREFLIAYNVNLNTRDRKLAHDIALDIREKGRAKRDDKGKIIRDSEGKIVRVPGLLRECKAVGWYMEAFDCAQVSINLTDYHITPVHKAFETVAEEAAKRGLRATGSELVGLIPLEAILQAGDYYLKRQGKSPGYPEKERVRMAVQSLGLSELTPFNPEKKIIEYCVQNNEEEPLSGMKIRDFADLLSIDTPAPGGGSVSALAGALAAGLASMVAHLTAGKKGYENVRERMLVLPTEAQELKDKLLLAIDEDTQAFNAVMEAYRLPKKSDEQKKAREKAVEKAVKHACRIPLKVMELSYQALCLCREVEEKGNVNSQSDAAVGVLMAQTAMKGAALNVRINLKDLKDADFQEKMNRTMKSLLEKMEEESGTNSQGTGFQGCDP
ncbi:MAG: glutamate formimidoyltransferase [Candidatus Marinimicrobia bacterium]|nr:glutamate formimidoyltransferase [Candidatus Neomarinimicrobiota bacterium]